MVRRAMLTLVAGALLASCDFAPTAPISLTGTYHVPHGTITGVVTGDRLAFSLAQSFPCVTIINGTGTGSSGGATLSGS